jgi:uncharacterized protein (DUF2147 family)
MKNFVLTAFFGLFVLISNLNAQEAGDKLIGLWEPSNGKARVKIEKIGNKYYGKIVWLKEPNDPQTGKPKLDKNNPDESMRSVPLKGYRMLKDFTYGDGEWSNGSIYDPESGSTYNCVIKAKDDNTLDIRGFVGVKALGRTDVWKRMKVN